MELKYLIVECEELSDQWECDCNRTPICITDEKGVEEYLILGYEIYSILPDGKLEKIKDYWEGKEEEEESGCAVFLWGDNDEITILKKLDIKQVKDISLKQVKELKKEFNLKQSAQEIFDDCRKYGVYYNENEPTIGEYQGNSPVY